MIALITTGWRGNFPLVSVKKQAGSEPGLAGCCFSHFQVVPYKQVFTSISILGMSLLS